MPDDAAGRSPALQLQAYNRAKHMLGRAARGALGQLERAGEGKAEDCRQLLAKLAEDRFNLVVLGQYKRGKSSLLNAILGRELLPTGMLPVTSAITTIRFGACERLVLARAGRLDETVPLGTLAQYVTQEGNPGNVKEIEQAYLELPLPLLRAGVHLVDTPGIGSRHEENTRTTRAFLPQADAVIFVTGVDTPLTEVETAFLQETRQYVRRTFFVVNKVDLLSDGERAAVLAYIAAGLAALTGEASVPLHPVSCRNALTALATGDKVLLQQSGLPALLAEITTFISREKRQVFLLSVLDRLTAALKAAGLSLADNESPHIRALGPLRDSLQKEASPLPELPAVPAAPTSARPLATEKALTGALSESQSDLAQLLHAPGCPICSRLSAMLFSFMADWQHAINHDETATSAYLSSQGFCPTHTWHFATLASTQTLAEAQPALLRAIADRLTHAVDLSPEQQQDEVAAVSPGTPSCIACDLLKGAEQALVARLLGYLQTPEGHSTYLRRSRGLCLRHLALLLALAPAPAVAGDVLRHQAARLTETAEDMESFALKHGALRRSLLHRNEETAATRALVYVAGDRNLALPWRVEGG